MECSAPARTSETGEGDVQRTLKASACGRCQRLFGSGLSFAMGSPTGDILKCFRCAVLHVPMLARSLAMALVVGSILAALNHGDSLFIGQGSSALLWKIPLTYLVPFFVATWGALTNTRR